MPFRDEVVIIAEEDLEQIKRKGTNLRIYIGLFWYVAGIYPGP